MVQIKKEIANICEYKIGKNANANFAIFVCVCENTADEVGVTATTCTKSSTLTTLAGRTDVMQRSATARLARK